MTGAIPQPPGRRGPGRPEALLIEGRRRRLFDAAQTVFDSRGYAAASMDEIAKLAGMSKTTIYRGFPTKDRLLHALVAHRSAELFPKRLGQKHDGVTEAVLTPRAIALLRLVIAEAPRAPEMAADLRQKLSDVRVLIAGQLLDRLLGSDDDKAA